MHIWRRSRSGDGFSPNTALHRTPAAPPLSPVSFQTLGVGLRIPMQLILHGALLSSSSGNTRLPRDDAADSGAFS